MGVKHLLRLMGSALDAKEIDLHQSQPLLLVATGDSLNVVAVETWVVHQPFVALGVDVVAASCVVAVVVLGLEFVDFLFVHLCEH